jgi:hypothetical protein
LDKDGREHFGEPVLEAKRTNAVKISEAFKIQGSIYGECESNRPARLQVAKVNGLAFLLAEHFRPHQITNLKLLSPLKEIPTIIGIGLNYRAHVGDH